MRSYKRIIAYIRCGFHVDCVTWNLRGIENVHATATKASWEPAYKIGEAYGTHRSSLPTVCLHFAFFAKPSSNNTCETHVRSPQEINSFFILATWSSIVDGIRWRLWQASGHNARNIGSYTASAELDSNTSAINHYSRTKSNIPSLQL